MSLFYAYSTPMFKSVTDSTLQFVSPVNIFNYNLKLVFDDITIIYKMCY